MRRAVEAFRSVVNCRTKAGGHPVRWFGKGAMCALLFALLNGAECYSLMVIPAEVGVAVEPDGSFPQWGTEIEMSAPRDTMVTLEAGANLAFWSGELVQTLDVAIGPDGTAVELYVLGSLPGGSSSVTVTRPGRRSRTIDVQQESREPPPPTPVIELATDASGIPVQNRVYSSSGRDPDTSEPYQLRITLENPLGDDSTVLFESPSGEIAERAPEVVSPTEIVVDAPAFSDTNGVVWVSVEEGGRRSDPVYYYVGSTTAAVLFVKGLPKDGQSRKIPLGIGNTSGTALVVASVVVDLDDPGITPETVRVSKTIPANSFEVFLVPMSRQGGASPAAGTVTIESGAEGGPTEETTVAIEVPETEPDVSVDGADTGAIRFFTQRDLSFGLGFYSPPVSPLRDGLPRVHFDDASAQPGGTIEDETVELSAAVVRTGSDGSFSSGEFRDPSGAFEAGDVGKWIVAGDLAFKIVKVIDETTVGYITAENGAGDAPDYTVQQGGNFVVARGSGVGAGEESYDLGRLVPDGIIEQGDILIVTELGSAGLVETAYPIGLTADYGGTTRVSVYAGDGPGYYDVGSERTSQWRIERGTKVHAAQLVHCSVSAESEIDLTLFVDQVSDCHFDLPSGSRLSVISSGQLSLYGMIVSCTDLCLAANTLLTVRDCTFDCAGESQGGSCSLLAEDIHIGSDVGFDCGGKTAGGTWFASAKGEGRFGCHVCAEPGGDFACRCGDCAWVNGDGTEMSACGGQDTDGGSVVLTCGSFDIDRISSVSACGGSAGDGGDVTCFAAGEVCCDGTLSCDGGSSSDGTCGAGGTAHGFYEVAVTDGVIDGDFVGLPECGMITYFDGNEQLAGLDYHLDLGLDPDTQRVIQGLDGGQDQQFSGQAFATGGVTLFCDRLCGQGSLSASGGDALAGTSALGGEGGSIYVFANDVDWDGSLTAMGGTPDGDANEPAIQILARSSVDLNGNIDGSGRGNGQGGTVWLSTLWDKTTDGATSVDLGGNVYANGGSAGTVLVTADRREAAGMNELTFTASGHVEAKGEGPKGVVFSTSGTLEDTPIARANSNAAASGTEIVVSGSIETTGGRVLILGNGPIGVPGKVVVESGDINVVSNPLGFAPGGTVTISGLLCSLMADWKTFVDGHLAGAILVAGTEDVLVGADAIVKGSGENGPQIVFNGDTVTIAGHVNASGNILGGIIALDARDMTLKSGSLVEAPGPFGGALQAGVKPGKGLPYDVDAQSFTIESGATVDLRGNQQDGILAIGDPDLGDPVLSVTINGTVYAIYYVAGDS